MDFGDASSAGFSIASTSALETILPYGSARGWRYTTTGYNVPLPTDWDEPGFDDSGWAQGDSAFGTGPTQGSCPIQVDAKTSWAGVGVNIGVRGVVLLPPGVSYLEVGGAIDDDLEFFWNGHRVGGHLSFGCAAYDQQVYTVDPSFYSAGVNVLAVRGNDIEGGQRFLDFTVRAVCSGGCPLLAEETLGACNPSEPHRCQAEAGDPVNTATGNFYEEFTDLAIPGRGVPLAFSRAYNSLDAARNGPLGYGWSHAYDAHLSVTGNSVAVIQENGSRVFFTLANNVWTAPPRVAATLAHNGDGSWTLTRRARQFLTFNASGKLIKIEDLNGRAATPAYATTLSYDGSGRLSTVTDPANRTLTFVYWPSGLLKTVTDSSSRQVGFAYDAQGNLMDVTNAAGGVTHLTYDSAHRMVTLLDPNQEGSVAPKPLTIRYDTQGRADRQTDPLERVTSFDYSSVSGSTIVTDPKGNKVRHAYQDGMLVSETRGYGTALAATWSYAYDPAGTLGVSTVTDPNGHVTSLTYDAQGNVLSRRVDPSGLNRLTTFTYDALNDVTSVTDGEGVTTTMGYDARGNRTSESTPLLASDGVTVIATRLISYAYTDAAHPGDVASMTDPNGKIWRYTYDSAGNLASLKDPLNNKTAYCYDAIGRRTMIVNPKGSTGFSCPSSPPDPPGAYTTTFTYDAMSRLLVSADALNHKVIRTYDANGNLETLKDANNNLTTYGYDLAGQLDTVARADDTVLGYAYWPDGTLKTQTDGAGEDTAYAYDALAHLTSVTDPLDRSTGYVFDAVGNLRSKVEPGGSCSGTPSGCTTYTYNAADELKTITYSDATPDVTDIDYDKNGRRISMIDGTGTSTFAWDSLGRMTESKEGGGAVVRYGYNLRGELETILYPGQSLPVTRTFDDAGRLSSVEDWLNNQSTFDYDGDSNLTGITYPNATTAEFTPDTADRLMAITHKKAGSAFASFTYTRDDANQVKTLTPTGVSQNDETYGYTQLNQVQSVNSGSYAYDAADNLTGLPSGQTLAYDAANELTTVYEPISLVGAGAAVDATGAQTSMTVNLSAAPQANDQILVAVDYKDGQNPTAPAGYTTVGTYSGSGTLPSRLSLYRKTATGSEGASIQVSFNLTPVPHSKAAAAVVYRGVDPSTPIDVLGGAGTAAAATSVTAPSVTATKSGEKLVMVMSAFGAAGTLGATWTAPSGMTKQVQSNVTTPAIAVAIADKTLGAAGGTGDQTATITTAEDLTGIQLALKRAATSYGYDTRGNRTSKTPPAGGATTYVYDQANRLKSVGSTSYTYNGDGLRMAKTVSGATSEMVWSLAEGLPLLLSDGTNNYLYGPGGMPLEQIPIQTISLVGAGAAVDATGAQTSMTVNLSAAPQANDQILLAVDYKDGQNPVPPAGYTSMGTFSGSGSLASRLSLYRKTATGSEGTSIQVSFNLTPVPHSKAAAAVIYRGVDPSTPIDVLGGAGTAAAATSVTAPSVTATKSGEKLVMVMSAFGAAGTLGATWTAPSGMTKEVQSNVTTPAVALAIADKTLGAAGATGDQTATITTAEDLTGIQLALKTPPPPILYHHQDQLGSTRVLTNGAGSVVAMYTFDAYGNTTAKTGSPSTPLQFAGEYTDAETGFQHLRARYYDPATEQFITVDPYFGVTFSRYAYVAGNPLNYGDPAGLMPLNDGPMGPPWATSKSGPTPMPTPSTDEPCQDPFKRSVGLLPTDGSFPYNSGLPGNQPNKLPGGQGFRDKYGNLWQWDPAKGEWDVQHPDGSHTNVGPGPNGEITHGPNNFPKQPKPHPDAAKIIGVGAAGATLWWLGKLLSPLCGPGAPACAVVL